MVKVPQLDERHWVPLGAACRMVEVNEATLRRWADRGLIRSYRTPGGHRRFALEDLRAVTEGARSMREGGGERDVADAALRHVRRRVHSRSAARQPWHERIQEEDRGRLRLIGRRLLTLATEYLSGRRRRSEVLEEARLVGEEHGAEMARLGLSLEDAIQAFAFFRNSVIEGLQDARASDAFPGVEYRAWQQVSAITDQVLQGIVQAYQRASASMATHQTG